MKEYKALEWFLSFINKEVEYLRDRNLLKFVLEMTDALDIPVKPETLVAKGSGDLGAQFYYAQTEFWKHMQEKLKEILVGLVQTIETIKKNKPDVFYSQLQLDKFSPFTKYSLPKIEIQFTLGVELQLIEASGGVKIDPLEIGRLYARAQGENLEHVITYYFVQSLQGLPVSSLKQCDECSGWFIQETKRNKIFCSSRCATKKANRERYQLIKELDAGRYEQELERGSKRAKRSYEARKANIQDKNKQTGV